MKKGRVTFGFAAFLGMCLSLSAGASDTIFPDGAAPAAGAYVNAQGSPLLPLIDSAQRTLDIEIYTMMSKLVRQSLRAAIARGVRIRILQEPSPVSDGCTLFTDAELPPKPVKPGKPPRVSSFNNDGTDDPGRPASGTVSADCQDLRKLVQDVRSGTPGSQYLPFNKPALCGGPADRCHQHGKLAIADGRTALVSTGNFDDTNLCDPRGTQSKCNRDYSMVLTDSKNLGTLADVFEHDLRGVSYDLQGLLNQHGNTALTVSPLSLQPLLDFINTAQHSIRLENQYLKNKQINALLAAKARSGVRVELTVASPCAFGKPTAYDVKEFNDIYGEFDSAGIVSRIFNSSNRINGKAGYMHAKVIVVDDSRAWVGSVNGSDPALEINREFGVFFDDPSWVRIIDKQVQADIADPNTETWQEGLECRKDSQGLPWNLE